MRYNDIVFGIIKPTKIVGDERVELELDLTSLGGKQSAYFSATYTAWSKYARRGTDCHSCGAGVERYARAFPQYARFFTWHLVSVDKGPMHYEANTLYW